MKKWPIIVVLFFLIVALAASLIKKSGGDRCALDGIRIEPIYRVDVADEEGKEHRFCCIECARKWLASYKGKAAAVTVTDEVTGKRIDSSVSFFVRSRIVTTPSTGSNIHVFAEKGDAERHAKDFEGTVIENPFAPPRDR